MIEWLTRTAEIPFWNLLAMALFGMVGGILLVAIWKDRWGIKKETWRSKISPSGCAIIPG